MDSNTDLQDLDKRVKRLENVHIWGVGIVIVGLLIFFLTKKGSDSGASISSGGSIGDGVAGGGNMGSTGTGNAVV